MATIQLIPLSKPNPPLFSLIESDSHYMVAVDLPSLPSHDNEVYVTKDELFVAGTVDGQIDQQKIFSCIPHGKGISATYKDGILWLSLPKAPKTKPALSVV